jgi:hypothetical protein
MRPVSQWSSEAVIIHVVEQRGSDQRGNGADSRQVVEQ